MRTSVEGRLPPRPPADPELAARLATAAELALTAGALLVEFAGKRARGALATEFKGRRELVTEADRRSEALIVGGLRRAFPQDAILAEEGVASAAGRIDGGGRFCWAVDPLDGTTNFVHGHHHFAVSIGLLEGGRPVLGAIHAPLLGGRAGGEFYAGGPGFGAFRDGAALAVSATGALADALVATGFSYRRNEPGVNTNLTNFGRLLMEVRGIRRCGSASIDLALTAAGVYDLFWELHLAPYDVAAGCALVLGAGGVVDDLGGGEGPIFGGEVVAGPGPLVAAARSLLEGRAAGRGRTGST